MVNNRWDEDYSKDCCSQQVRILFSALYTTINELGEEASLLQDRDVKSHIIEIVRSHLFDLFIVNFYRSDKIK